MDPPAGAQLTRSDRFPRPRGDGPLPDIEGIAPPMVSPPTRGWTRRAGRRGILRMGFPAHAGMDRRGGHAEPCWTTVSPPTRGWTPSPTNFRPCAGGFPAHAGMDLMATVPSVPFARFPRPRGDGPPLPLRHLRRGDASSPATAAPAPGGFPAHAGMDRQRGSSAASRSGFPRPRGDGPLCRGSRIGPTSVSPPTRGWTVLRARRQALGEGFPAHAGMDPSADPRSAR